MNFNQEPPSDYSSNGHAHSGNGSSNALSFSKLSSASSKGFEPPPVVQGMPKRKRKPIEKKLSIQEVLKILYRGRWIILGMFVLVFSYTVYSTYSKPFIYSASTRMFIEKPPAAAQMRPITGEDDHSIANQMAFFRSHVIAKHVAELLHKYATGDRTELDSLYTEYFHSTASIPSDRSKLTITRQVDNPKAQSPPGVPNETILETRATTAITIVPDPSNDYLLVSAEGYTPEDAAFLANTFVVVYAKDNLSRSRSNSVALKDFLAGQVKKSYDTLYHVESQLKDYLQESEGLGVEEKAANLMNQYDQTKLKRDNLTIELAQRRKVYEDLVSNLDTVQKNFFDNLTLEPQIAILKDELAKSEFDVEQSEATENVMAPQTKKYLNNDLQAQRERIATLHERLREKAEELLHSKFVVPSGNLYGNPEAPSAMTQGGTSVDAVTQLRQAILDNKLKIGQEELVLNAMNSLLNNLQAQIGSMPEKIIRAAQLKRDQGSAEKLYTQLEDKYMDAWLAEQSVFGSVRVEDPAALNPTPVRPNRQASIFSGALIGLGVGIGVVLLLSFMDSTIRSPDELESQGYSVLATIPIINQLSAGLSKELVTNGTGLPKFTPHKISHLDPRSSIAEAYRSLRTSIQFSGLDRDISSLMITSSAPQEGKSTTSANIGIVMAQMGKRTLLLDTDLRRPVMHSVFGVAREPGLTNVLFNRCSLEEAIQKTDVPNLYILPCGIVPPNPAELLESQKMKDLIKRLKEEFDMLIFDTPPVVAVTDSLILSRYVDGVLLIARSDTTRSDTLMRSVDLIERSGSRLLGLVLNNFNVARAYGSYYRYYQYYHYYSSELPQKQTLLQRFRFKGPKNIKKGEGLNT